MYQLERDYLVLWHVSLPYTWHINISVIFFYKSQYLLFFMSYFIVPTFYYDCWTNAWFTLSVCQSMFFCLWLATILMDVVILVYFSGGRWGRGHSPQVLDRHQRWHHSIYRRTDQENVWGQVSDVWSISLFLLLQNI